MTEFSWEEDEQTSDRLKNKNENQTKDKKPLLIHFCEY